MSPEGPKDGGNVIRPNFGSRKSLSEEGEPASIVLEDFEASFGAVIYHFHSLSEMSKKLLASQREKELNLESVQILQEHFIAWCRERSTTDPYARLDIALQLYQNIRVEVGDIAIAVINKALPEEYFRKVVQWGADMFAFPFFNQPTMPVEMREEIAEMRDYFVEVNDGMSGEHGEDTI